MTTGIQCASNRAIVALAILLSGVFGLANAWAQTPSNWRVFKAADGLRETPVTSVTVSPGGKVWARHGEAGVMSRLDGYTISQVPAPGGNYRIYESSGDQIWSLYSDGLQEFKNGRWIRYFVDDIRIELQADPMRRVRQIPLVPIEKDRVLFLLSERLREWNGGAVSTVMDVADTHLEKLLDMTFSSTDGGLWVTGKKGILKFTRTSFGTNAAPVWKEFLFDEDLKVENALRPVDDGQGGLTMVADSQSTRKRVSIHFDGKAWHAVFTLDESIRQSWRGLDHSFWGLTINTLLRLDNGQPNYVVKEDLGGGQYFDIATETNGVFWLATVDGLFRNAPPLWRTPGEMADLATLVHSIRQDREGRLWFLSANSLARQDKDKLHIFPFEEGAEQLYQPTDAPFFMPSGSLALNINDQLHLFDPKTETFTPVRHPTRPFVKLVGQFQDGRLCTQTFDPRQLQLGYHLDSYDGRKFVHYLDSIQTAPLGMELFAFLTTSNGSHWIGGVNGLGAYRDKQWHMFDATVGFHMKSVFSMLELNGGKMWFGGPDRIFEYDGKSWQSIKSGFSRISTMIRGRDGSIWVATGNGLYRYFRETWIEYGKEEGLPSLSVYEVFEDREGRIWVGTTRGISQFHPEADRDPPMAEVDNLESLKHIAADEPVIINFSGRDKWKYTPSERLLYSWRLDGGEWTHFGSLAFAKLRDLSAGPHRFQLRAMDRNFNESLEPANVEFALILPWYRERRVLVIALFGLGLALFFAGVAVNRHLRLKRSYAEVGKIVDERTRELELANQELLLSQKMTALGTLAAGIAHDFNNILSIIKGSAQIIESNLEDKEKIRVRVERIKTVVDQGSEIVKAMLGYSRDGGKGFENLDVNATIEGTLKLLGDRFLREVTVSFEPAAPLPTVFGSKDLIQQMLLNLILNAADAIHDKGEITLRTGLLHQLPVPFVLEPAQSPNYVFICVTDKGAGIAPENISRIFEPFFTTKAFSSRRGTGLGLSTVYQFAKELKYGLRVQSEVGKGTTFTIVIPERQKESGK